MMSEKPGNSISCGNCSGLCCRAMTTMPLKQSEVDFHRAGGTKLKEFLPAGDTVNWSGWLYFKRHFKPKDIFDADRETKFTRGRAKKLSRGEGLYGLETDCGYLQETPEGPTVCTAYDDPQKPRICGDFSAGSFACKEIRKEHGITPGGREIDLSLVSAALGQTAVESFDTSTIKPVPVPVL